MTISKEKTASLLNFNTCIERDTEQDAIGKGKSEPRPVPPTVPVGKVMPWVLEGGEEVLVIGASLGRFRKRTPGLPVIISPNDWEHLQQWKYTRLLIVSGQVRASDGGNSRPLVARFLTNTTYSTNATIRYRNGNALDLRRDNITVIPNGLLLGAERIKSEPAWREETVTLSDGRLRTRRKPQVPNALERLEALLQNEKQNDRG